MSNVREFLAKQMNECFPSLNFELLIEITLEINIFLLQHHFWF